MPSERAEKVYERDDFLWNGAPLKGRCGHCNRSVDSTDPNHRVTSIVVGGRGVECVLAGEIPPEEGGRLDGF